MNTAPPTRAPVTTQQPLVGVPPSARLDHEDQDRRERRRARRRARASARDRSTGTCGSGAPAPGAREHPFGYSGASTTIRGPAWPGSPTRPGPAGGRSAPRPAGPGGAVPDQDHASPGWSGAGGDRTAHALATTRRSGSHPSHADLRLGERAADRVPESSIQSAPPLVLAQVGDDLDRLLGQESAVMKALGSGEEYHAGAPDRRPTQRAHVVVRRVERPLVGGPVRSTSGRPCRTRKMRHETPGSAGAARSGRSWRAASRAGPSGRRGRGSPGSCP